MLFSQNKKLVEFNKRINARVQSASKVLGKYFTSKNIALAGASTCFLLSLTYATSLFWPQNITINYASPACINNPVVLPKLISRNKSTRYQAAPVASLSVAGYPIYARTVCVTAITTPKENASETIVFGKAIIKKSLHVLAPSFPALAQKSTLDSPISTGDDLTLKLNQPANIFQYKLLGNDKVAACTQKDKTISCNVSSLQLAQSAEYNISLQRLFKNKPAGTVFNRQLRTVEAVNVLSTSITAGQTVYDAPGQLVITLNRPIETIKNGRLYLLAGDKRTEMSAAIKPENNTVVATFAKPLDRSAEFALSIDKLVAADGGYLATPIDLHFKTSGGPKVLGANIGSYKVPLGSSFAVKFDTAVSTTQALKDFIHLEVGGKVVDASVSLNGSAITIKPTASLPHCAAITLVVQDGLQNQYGIAGGSAWQYKSRTLCQTVFSIGNSVQGRSINAYSFGTGASRIVYVGTTHGDEKSSTYLLNKWIETLEASPGNIPANRTIVVIPNLNPDGYAANTRTNASGVDLNRNFPTADWKQSVVMPDGSTNTNGGGSAPLSEPESLALANYITGQSPRLVLTYHAKAGLVIPNDAGDSVALAKQYDQKSNLYFSTGGGVFQYDTTGAFEDWLYQSRSVTALLIELWTMTGDEYAKNTPAMWTMAQLP